MVVVLVVSTYLPIISLLLTAKYKFKTLLINKLTLLTNKFLIISYNNSFLFHHSIDIDLLRGSELLN